MESVFVLYNKEVEKLAVTSFMRLSSNRSWIATNRNARRSSLFFV